MVTGTEQVKDQLNEGTAVLEEAIDNTQETLIQMDDQGHPLVLDRKTGLVTSSRVVGDPFIADTRFVSGRKPKCLDIGSVGSLFNDAKTRTPSSITFVNEDGLEEKVIPLDSYYEDNDDSLFFGGPHGGITVLLNTDICNTAVSDMPQDDPQYIPLGDMPLPDMPLGDMPLDDPQDVQGKLDVVGKKTNETEEMDVKYELNIQPALEEALEVMKNSSEEEKDTDLFKRGLRDESSSLSVYPISEGPQGIARVSSLRSSNKSKSTHGTQGQDVKARLRNMYALAKTASVDGRKLNDGTSVVVCEGTSCPVDSQVAGYTHYSTGGCAGRNELATTTGGSLQDCADSCTNDSTCVSFEYGKADSNPSDSWYTKCQRSTSCDDYSLTLQNENDPFDFYLRIEQIAGYTHYSTGGCSGRNELATTTGGSVQDCADSCTNDSTCVSFEYGKADSNPSDSWHTKCQRSTSCNDYGLTLQNENDPFDFYLRIEEPVPGSSTLSNIARQGTPSQSSECYGGGPSKVIDGFTGGNWWHGSVMHTCDGADQCTCDPDQVSPWWMVDLGADKHTITQVKIYNRVDCCMNRMDSSEVQILDDQGTVVASQRVQGALPVYTFDFDDVIGRSVRIQKSQGVLNIAEVEVMGWSEPVPSESDPFDFYLGIKEDPECPRGYSCSVSVHFFSNKM